MAETFDEALAGIKQMFIDLDGDGRPDVAVPARAATAQRFGTPGAEMRSANTQAGDFYGERFGPAVGQVVSGIDRGARTVGDFLWGMTGVPSAQRSGELVSKFQDTGDWKDAAAAGGNALMAALPYSMVGRGAASGASMTPLALGTAGGAMTIPLGAAEAKEAGRGRVSKAIEADPEVRRLRAERDRIMRERTAVNEKHARSGRETQRQALEPYNQDLARYDGTAEQPGLIKQAEDAAAAAAMQEAPFRERNPGAAETIATAFGAAAGGIPFVNTVTSRIGARSKGNAANALATAIERDLAGKGRNAVPPAELARRLDEVNLLAAPPSLAKRAYTVGSEAGSVGKSAFLMAEGASLPEQVDYISYAPGSVPHDEAARSFRDPDYYKERIGPGLLGVGLYGAGKGVGYMLTPNAGVNVPLIESLNRVGGPQQAQLAQNIAGYRNGLVNPPAPAPIPAPAGGGPALLPAAPAAGQIQAPPNIPPVRAPAGRSPGNPSPSYRDPEKAAARPFIVDEIAAGRNAPDQAALQAHLSTQGLNKPLPGYMADNLKTTQALVDTLRARGATPAEIAEVVRAMLGKPGFPAIGAAGLTGAVATWSDEQPRNLLGR